MQQQPQPQLVIYMSVDELRKVIRECIKEQPSSSNRGPQSEELLTRGEVAERYQATLNTIDTWEKCGIIPKRIKKGGKVFFRKSDIEMDIKQKK